MVSSSTRPPVLYTARLAWWVRAVVIIVVGGIALLVGGGCSALLLVGDGPNAVGWAALLLSMPMVLAVVVFAALGLWISFTVTTEGIVLRGFLRTRRIPWREIDRIEVDHGWVHRGQTVVVLHDGRRLGSPLTEARAAMRRGERTSDHGADLKHPARPALAAIDAHRRWLRGEFGAR